MADLALDVIREVTLAGRVLDQDDLANAVRFWGEVNPDFFKGTVVEKEAAAVLAGAGRKPC